MGATLKLEAEGTQELEDRAAERPKRRLVFRPGLGVCQGLVHATAAAGRPLDDSPIHQEEQDRRPLVQRGPGPELGASQVILEMEPGVGKLVSLMSLQMLPRRLSLDFRDVFSKGFHFDRINGNMGIVCTVQHVNVVLKNGDKKSMFVRETDCFEKRADEWRLIHQHASVPAGGAWDGKIVTEEV